MAMHDWNDYRNQILARVGEIGKLSPDTVKGYMALSGAGATTGHLDVAWRRLVHEHSHAFDAVHAGLPRFVTLNNHMPVGRLPGRSPSTTPASRKQNPAASGPTDDLARCGES